MFYSENKFYFTDPVWHVYGLENVYDVSLKRNSGHRSLVERDRCEVFIKVGHTGMWSNYVNKWNPTGLNTDTHTKELKCFVESKTNHISSLNSVTFEIMMM